MEAAVLGYVLRQKLVKEVREEYESVVQSLEGDLPPSSLTTATRWPSSRLCRPVHDSAPAQSALQQEESDGERPEPREIYQELSSLSRGEGEGDPSGCWSGSPPLSVGLSPAPSLSSVAGKPHSATPYDVTDSPILAPPTDRTPSSVTPETCIPYHTDHTVTHSPSPDPPEEVTRLALTTSSLALPIPNSSKHLQSSTHTIPHVAGLATPSTVTPTDCSSFMQSPQALSVNTASCIPQSPVPIEVTTPVSTLPTNSLSLGLSPQGLPVASTPRSLPHSLTKLTPPILATPLTSHWYPAQLPRDREALMKLRTEMLMELLWVEQAISSRKKYLMLKKQLEKQ